MNNKSRNISDGKNKDLILKYIIQNKTLTEFHTELFPEKSKDYLVSLLKEIEELDLIKVYYSNNECILTKIGLIEPFLEKGGFEKIEKVENHKKQKDIIDFKISKFKYYTFWIFFLFTLIGFGLSVFNFINNLSPSKNEVKQEERIEKMELELKKLHTSILTQKNHDFSNTSKENDTIK